jgi:predicted PurR-regulated permease PerM
MDEFKPIDVPFRVFLKIFIAAFVVFALLKIAPLLLLLLLAVLIATTLYPVEQWLVTKKVPRTLAFALIAILLIGTLVAFLFVLLPKVVEQFGTLPDQFTKVTKDLSEKISDENVRAKLQAALKDPPKLIGNIPEKIVAISSGLMGGLFSIGLLLVMSLYLLADGRKTYRWIRAFFGATNQKKLDETADAVSKIVSAYVAGQFITSGLVAVFVFALLTLTHVPAAISLATIAAIFDILPMIGFLVSLGAAGLIALTVSASTALIVVGAFLGYHFLENYVIVPKIYGNRMRLSGLVVLLSLIFAVEIGGVLLGILILPVIAAYPIVEKIWLAKALGARTIAQHASLEEEAEAKPKPE